jgi:hypothetical protein
MSRLGRSQSFKPFISKFRLPQTYTENLTVNMFCGASRKVVNFLVAKWGFIFWS